LDEPKAAAGQSASTPAEATPLSLLERLRRNEGQAWRRAMQLYEPLIGYWCRRAGLGQADAEDVTQEVFAAAAAGIGEFHRDRPGDTFRGWLRGITRRQILCYFRRNRLQRAEGGSDAWNQLQELADPLSTADDEEHTAVEQVYLRALEQVRAQFQPQTWQAFWRTAVEGASPAEVVGEIGMSLAAIRQAKSRVLRRLKQEMGELLG
jgi:RNA polymerase sigma-70 factor (ECF subfamily)